MEVRMSDHPHSAYPYPRVRIIYIMLNCTSFSPDEGIKNKYNTEVNGKRDYPPPCENQLINRRMRNRNSHTLNISAVGSSQTDTCATA
jgi:hypothetical protein